MPEDIEKQPDENDEQAPPQEPVSETPPEAPPAEDATPSAPTVPDADGIKAVEEDALREMYEQLEEWRVGARERRDVDGVRAALAEKQRIADELTRRDAAEKQRDAELAELDKAEVPSLPEKEVAPAGSGASAAQLAATSASQPIAEVKPPTSRARPTVPLLAAAGTEVLPAGEPMNYAQLGQAIDRAKRGRPGQTILASLPGFEAMTDESMPTPLSERNGVSVNDELIQEAIAQWREREVARTAGLEPDYGAWTGAICEPFDIIRDIPDAFVTDMPVSAIFPSRPAGRGGFQFTASGSIADVVGGVSRWTEDDQAAVDPSDDSTWKPCVEYDCPEATSAVLEWITVCATFPITLEMSNPERVRNLNNALGALEARTYEGRILQRIDQLSHGYVFSGDYGALPTVVEAVNTVLAQLTFAERQRKGNYTLIIPPSFVETILIDRMNHGFNADETADVMNVLRANIPSVRVVESLDASLGGEPGLPFVDLPPIGNQAAAASPDFLTGQVLRLRLVDPSAAIYAETGEMNAGVLRDANLIRQNRTGFFRERGFFLEKHGPQPWATIDVRLCADGARAALTGPHGCATS